MDGQPITLDTVDSSTWVRRDGQWLCVVHTEAPVGDPYGRDPCGRAHTGRVRLAPPPGLTIHRGWLQAYW